MTYDDGCLCRLTFYFLLAESFFLRAISVGGSNDHLRLMDTEYKLLGVHWYHLKSFTQSLVNILACSMLSESF